MQDIIVSQIVKMVLQNKNKEELSNLTQIDILVNGGFRNTILEWK
jgi:hypothetical protein